MNEITILIYSSLAVNVILLFLFIMILLKTPAMAWIKALLLNKMILAILRKDKKIDFQVVDYKNDNAFTKKYGYFNICQDAIYSWDGGVRGGFALSGKIVSPPPYLISAVEELTKKGFENYTECETAAEVVRLMKKENLNEINERILKEKGYTDNFINYFSELNERGLIEQMKDRNSMVNFHILETFFRYNASPSSVYKVIEMEVAKRMEQLNTGFKITINHVIMIVILLIGAALAYVIITGSGSHAVSQVVSSAAKTAETVGGGVSIQ